MPLVDVGDLSRKICTKPVQVKLKYATAKNFVGRPIAGYDPAVTDIALLTRKAANALCNAQNYLLEKYDYGLLIYDAYRPKRAVKDFMAWSKQKPASDYELERKAKHYPHIEKNQLFDLGYLSEDSNHCYGNTVDLVLINLKTNEKLDMGACFDYMDVKSHLTAGSEQIGEEAYRHRQILCEAMQQFGFQPYEKEFWHFCHGGEAGREVV